MVAACSSGAGNNARGYTGGGKSDWSMPSKDELNQLYLQKVTVGGFAAVNYWSSSQDGSGFAWLQFFVSGGQGSVTKSVTSYVRPIRAFSN